LRSLFLVQYGWTVEGFRIRGRVWHLHSDDVYSRIFLFGRDAEKGVLRGKEGGEYYLARGAAGH
jgi:hypothetical protein